MENFISMIIFIFLLSIIIIKIIEKTQKKEKNKKMTISPMPTPKKIENTQTKIIENENRKYYEKKRYLITKSEYILYKRLIQICNKYDLIVNSQVPLYQIIDIKLNKGDKNYLKYFNKIKSKSIDFVIIDKTTTRILQCIELDDYTHNYYTRQKRDIFVNTLFKDLDIKLLRINSSNFDERKLEEIIKNNCTDRIYSEEG